MAGDPDFPVTLELLARLHRHKDAAYGDAWRKRDEVIAIFANLARKYDRLVIGMTEAGPASTDPLADTVGDLCVYSGKYLTWLAETQPIGFDAHSVLIDAATASAERGPAALEAVFGALIASDAGNPRLAESAEDAWAILQAAFNALENGLMAQADPASLPADNLTWPEKIDLAWALTAASAWLLTHVAREMPERLAGLRRDVAAMDAQSLL